MRLIDTTLRDGEQTPGVCFTLEYKLRIASLLSDLGVQEMELRAPVLDPQGEQDWNALQSMNLPIKPLCWCRARREDLDSALRIGARRVHIALPVSDVQLGTLRMEWESAMDRLSSLVNWASQHFDYVSVGAQDASRAEPERLLGYADCVLAAGARRLRLADTLGLMTPMRVMQMIQALKQAAPDLELEFHAHNDLGMATANAMMALDAGAGSVSATVLGLGERCGNASLEQLALSLSLTHGDLYNTSIINDLCRTVAAGAGIGIPCRQPLVGGNAVRHQSGIHVAGLLRDIRSYTPYDPALVGRSDTQELLVGALTGRGAIRHFLESCNIHPDDAALERLLPEVRRRVRELGRDLRMEELCSLYQGSCAA